ncbi:MAG: hypothetical protein ACI8ZX_002279 [Planctomycetota bacterium]|jgi:hypothetical protein
MILTPTSRYGIAQALTLKVWPLIKYILRGSAKPYRGVPIETLGQAMAKNIFVEGACFEKL